MPSPSNLNRARANAGVLILTTFTAPTTQLCVSVTDVRSQGQCGQSQLKVGLDPNANERHRGPTSQCELGGTTICISQYRHGPTADRYRTPPLATAHEGHPPPPHRPPPLTTTTSDRYHPGPACCDAKDLNQQVAAARYQPGCLHERCQRKEQPAPRCACMKVHSN